MNEKKLGLDPAFSNSINHYIGEDISGNPVYQNVGNNGMSKRLYIACAAMQGLNSNEFWLESMTASLENQEEIVRVTVQAAFEFADELLKQEAE